MSNAAAAVFPIKLTPSCSWARVYLLCSSANAFLPFSITSLIVLGVCFQPKNVHSNIQQPEKQKIEYTYFRCNNGSEIAIAKIEFQKHSYIVAGSISGPSGIVHDPDCACFKK